MSEITYQTETKILRGKNVLEQLCDECLTLGDKVLIVFSENMIKQSGLYARVVSLLNICGIEHITYECEEKKYSDKEINNAVELGRKENVQLVLAIGDDELMCFSKIVAHKFHNDIEALKPVKQHLPIINITSFLNLNSGTNRPLQNIALNYNHVKPATLFVDFEY